MASVSPTKKLMKKPEAKPAAAAPAPAPAAAKAAPAAKKAPSPKVVEKAAAPAEAEQVNAVETPEVESNDMIVQTAKEVENIKEAKAFEMIPRLMDDNDRNSFRLGGYLSKIQAEGWFLNKGYENFKAYVEAECSIKYRKAMYLIGIYNGLVAAQIPWSKVQHLGWTKLKELAGILTAENVDEWVTVAESMTALQLIDYIAKQTAGNDASNSTENGDGSSNVTTMTFKLHKDQKESVEEALQKAKHASGTEVNGAALEYICLDYLGSAPKVVNLTELMKTKALEDVLQSLQEAFPTLVMQASLYDTVEEAQAAQAEIDAAAAGDDNGGEAGGEAGAEQQVAEEAAT
jgi:hypothetical protein